MNLSALDVFNFIRGALRGSYGIETLSDKKIAILGMDTIGLQLLTMFCIPDGPDISFYDNRLINYNAAHIVCNSISSLERYDKEDFDIAINFYDNHLLIVNNLKSKRVEFSEIGDDPYTQGIHEFYI